MEEEKVILVDKNDFQLGLMPKMEAHKKGVLHRAFSVFIFNSTNSLLMQKRSMFKYHSPGLWTNTCCSHQRDGESTIEAANRRLMEEMGLVVKINIPPMMPESAVQKLIILGVILDFLRK